MNDKLYKKPSVFHKTMNKQDQDKLSARMARLLLHHPDLDLEYPLVSAPRALHATNPTLELNPLVVIITIAGVLGVVIIAVIILSVWIRSRFSKVTISDSSSSTSDLQLTKEIEHVDASSAIMSMSLSTLNNHNHNQNDDETMGIGIARGDVTRDDSNNSLSFNDTQTTFYSAVDCSNISFNPGSDLDETITRTEHFSSISLSPFP